MVACSELWRCSTSESSRLKSLRYVVNKLLMNAGRSAVVCSFRISLQLCRRRLKQESRSLKNSIKHSGEDVSVTFNLSSLYFVVIKFKFMASIWARSCFILLTWARLCGLDILFVDFAYCFFGDDSSASSTLLTADENGLKFLLDLRSSSLLLLGFICCNENSVDDESKLVWFLSRLHCFGLLHFGVFLPLLRTVCVSSLFWSRS